MDTTKNNITNLIILVVASFIFSSCTDPSLSATPTRDNFLPFQHMSTIVPGKTRKSEVVKMFGKPDSEKIGFQGIFRTDEGKVVEFGGHQTLEYNNFGLKVLISRGDVKKPDPTINVVFATEKYRGTGPYGLQIGMAEAEALEICDSNYKRVKVKENKYSYAEVPNGDSNFVIEFSEKRLSNITMYPAE